MKQLTYIGEKTNLLYIYTDAPNQQEYNRRWKQNHPEVFKELLRKRYNWIHVSKHFRRIGIYDVLYTMTTTIQDFLDTGIVFLAFRKIDSYTNERGEV